ncbi:type II toxin-antitoxin system Phd/YefM family antitoxin [Streptacidiphilus sp. PAMC 29251]
MEDAVQWQVQEAKQRFSEVLRRAHEDGPQVVTRHGAEVAVVIDIGEYRRLKGEELSFKGFLTTPAEAWSEGFAEAVDEIVAARQDDRERDLSSLFEPSEPFEPAEPAEPAEPSDEEA